MEIIGERWTLLIVRDLLVGPKRFSDLQRGLSGIPSNILTERLKELEEAHLVQRRALPRPSPAVVYELTADGSELEEAVISIGRWGAKRLGEPRPDEVITEDSMASALLTTFRPEEAARMNLRFELRLGEIIIHAHVQNRKVTVGRGPLDKADLKIEAGPKLRQLLAREISPQEALRKKIVRISGDPKLLTKFVQLFQI
ncbi:MAG: winged helix-turn-helix transcriptional regulator [Candidatus Eremiobacteraeota bacterium]|nr:winged helix-turn-helix transcriptional regulator [Candidatus Eremiobacteraeota bacterium]